MQSRMARRAERSEPRTARRAERSEPRSGVLDSSEQPSYQGDRVRPAPPWSAARSHERHPRSGRIASSVVSVCRASKVTRSHGQKAET